MRIVLAAVITIVARRFTTLLLPLFGAAALAISGLGIYEVIAVAKSQRTREIGLRLAMGGEPRNVVGLVVRGAGGLAGGGIAVGLLASPLFSQTLTGLLFNVAPFDAPTLAAVSLLLLGWPRLPLGSPARRASRADPLVAVPHGVGVTAGDPSARRDRASRSSTTRRTASGPGRPAGPALESAPGRAIAARRFRRPMLAGWRSTPGPARAGPRPRRRDVRAG